MHRNPHSPEGSLASDFPVSTKVFVPTLAVKMSCFQLQLQKLDLCPTTADHLDRPLVAVQGADLTTPPPCLHSPEHHPTHHTTPSDLVALCCLFFFFYLTVDFKAQERHKQANMRNNSVVLSGHMTGECHFLLCDLMSATFPPPTTYSSSLPTESNTRYLEKT